jgi:hypothetical protein
MFFSVFPPTLAIERDVGNGKMTGPKAEEIPNYPFKWLAESRHTP